MDTVYPALYSNQRLDVGQAAKGTGHLANVRPGKLGEFLARGLDLASVVLGVAPRAFPHGQRHTWPGAGHDALEDHPRAFTRQHDVRPGLLSGSYICPRPES